MAATGKIARLPPRLREQVNRRLHDGQPDQAIADWLNTLPEVKTIMDQAFEGEPVKQQNVNNWRNGEHQKWIEQEREVLQTREWAEFSMRLASEAGLDLSAGAKALAAGRIMERLKLASEGTELEELLALSKTADQLHRSDLDSQRVNLDERKTAVAERTTALKESQYRLRFVLQYIDLVQDEEARQIAAGPGSRDAKAASLIKRFFGEMPANIGPQTLLPAS
jgi:hypothetical protein